MKTMNNELVKTPGIQIFLIRSNLTNGTTGDTRYFVDTNSFYTGMGPNFSIEIINREIQNRKEQNKSIENASA
jgi:hypothetical protein